MLRRSHWKSRLRTYSRSCVERHWFIAVIGGVSGLPLVADGSCKKSILKADLWVQTTAVIKGEHWALTTHSGV